MFKSTTDYTLCPTMAELSENDRAVLFKKPLSEQDILDRFEELKNLYLKENQILKEKIVYLDNEVKELKKEIKEISKSSTLMVDQRKELVKSSTLSKKSASKTSSQPANLKAGQIYVMGTYGGEKIQWRVLKIKGKKALLFSEKGLESKVYHGELCDITWEQCDLRQWLNEEFVNIAFSPEEKDRLVKTEVKNPKNLEYETDGGNSTKDQVFLLCIDEVREYFKTDEERICYPTEYAKKQGVWVKEGDGSCIWWIRSPGSLSGSAAKVIDTGFVDGKGSNVNHNFFAVRPAAWINLQSEV